MINLISVFIVLAAHGQASPVGQEVGVIRSLILAEKWNEALAITRQLEDSLVQRAHLEVKNGKVLAEPPAGLGMYKELPGGLVKEAEIYLYAEVENHRIREKGGNYEIHLVSDLFVLDAQGNELARDEAFGESRFSAKTRHEKTFVLIALKSAGLPTGNYTMRLLVHDKIGNKSSQIDIPLRRP
ncbi:MAG: hypothetical protein CMH60_02450 [Myxococcales bacterium]|nr:hypothetical protein [Myxococcales bacterium]|tara:strand:- start:1058 stop:1609 length:552 start_codon:yes stop_codon:yes gene_type:complete